MRPLPTGERLISNALRKLAGHRWESRRWNASGAPERHVLTVASALFPSKGKPLDNEAAEAMRRLAEAYRQADRLVKGADARATSFRSVLLAAGAIRQPAQVAVMRAAIALWPDPSCRSRIELTMYGERVDFLLRRKGAQWIVMRDDGLVYLDTEDETVARKELHRVVSYAEERGWRRTNEAGK